MVQKFNGTFYCIILPLYETSLGLKKYKNEKEGIIIDQRLKVAHCFQTFMLCQFTCFGVQQKAVLILSIATQQDFTAF